MTVLEQQLSVRPSKAAKLLDVGRGTIHQLLASGELRSFKIGTARLIYVDDLRSFIERRRDASVAH
jgi:excisionase family DNA binding protein